MEKSTGFKNVILDLGGVIIDIDYSATSKAMQNIGISNFDDLFTQYHQNKLFADFEKGVISPFSFINCMLDFCTIETTPNQIVHAWNKMIGDFRPAVVDLIHELKKHFNIYLLSNTNIIHYEYVLRKWRKTYSFNFENLFDEVFLSHEISMRKPDEEVFNYVLKKNHLVAENTIFIDDSYQHIEAAKKLNINTHLYSEEKSFIHLFS